MPSSVGRTRGNSRAGSMREKGGKLLGPGGQQDIALCFGEKLRRVHGRLEHHASCREGTFGPQQPVVFDLAPFCTPPQCFWWHPLRRGWVASTHRSAPCTRAAISSGVNRPQCTVMPAKLPCSSLPSGVATLTRTSAPSWASSLGKNAALGGAAEDDCFHPRYPLGVTIRPLSCFVSALPMKTVVNISTGGMFQLGQRQGRGGSGPPARCSAPSRRRSGAVCRVPAGCGPLFQGSPAAPWRRGCTARCRNRPWLPLPAAAG